MPVRLLSVISGILAGEIPGFRIELCCFFHPLTWPRCVILCFLCSASSSVAILIMSSDQDCHRCFVIVFGLGVRCVFSVFCLVSGLFSGCVFLFVFLLGQLAGLRTGPLPVLLWLSTSRQPCMIITIHLFAAIECV